MTQNNTLTIMQVLPSLVSGGVETGTIDMAKALIESGHRALVVSCGGQMVTKLDDIGAKHIVLPVHSKNPLTMLKNARAIKQLIQSENIDLIHARSRAPAWSCYWATRSTNIPFITTFHGTYGHKSALKRWYNRIMLKSDITIAVSSFIAKHIALIYGSQANTDTRNDNTRVIHRGIDMHKFDPKNIQADSISQQRKRWQIPDKNIVMMLPGRITRWKGHSFVIEALAKLKQNHITCLMVGDNKGKDHYLDELNGLIEHHQLTDTLKIVGGCHDMPTAYSLSDIVISASTEPEAFGRVACEAQAMECLVIATQHGGSLETIAPEQQHLMCQASDADSMLESIKSALDLCLADNQALSHSIKKASRLHIEQNFTLELMCTKTLALYNEVTANKGLARLR